MRVYLDNAATSWPKPDSVYQAVDHAMRVLGAPAGRGGYPEAMEVERRIGDCRMSLLKLLGASAGDIIFTQNTTDSLNLAIHGFVRQNDHVVTSVAEHNSVIRPLRQLEASHQVKLDLAATDDAGIVDLNAIESLLQPETRLVAITHASNVTGALQPIGELHRLLQPKGIPLLVDAAQTMGHIDWNMDDCPAEMIAGAGHKGLMGPLGMGWLFLQPGMADQLEPIRQGGTGTQSELETQPTAAPAKFESGNLNVPGILGLAAGIDFLLEQDRAAQKQRDESLTQQLVTGLESLDGAHVFGPADLSRRVPVVSFQISGFDPQELAAMLDSAAGVQVRAGLHCAALMHQRLGTVSAGGTVRVSPGWFTTAAEITTTLEVLQALVG